MKKLLVCFLPSLVSMIFLISTGCAPSPKTSLSPSSPRLTTPTTEIISAVTPTSTIASSTSSASGVDVVPDPATLISDSSAVLNGRLLNSNFKGSVKVYFNYGSGIDNLSNATPGTIITARSTFSESITDLKPNTTYFFQPVADGSATKGSILSFTTAFINSDYFEGFINNSGTLKFTNKTTGALILDNAPAYNFDYDIISSNIDVSPANNSFEKADAAGVPEEWTVDKTYIRQSAEQASQGTKSLKFNLTAADTDHRRAYSSLININRDKIYAISADSYLSSYTTGYPKLMIAYYKTVDGSGTAGYNDIIDFPVSTGHWVTSSDTWNPPYGAKTFRVLIYCNQSDVEVLYVDNIIINEIGLKNQTNGNVISSVATSGNDVTVLSTDNSNPDITVDNKYELNVHSPNIKYTATITYKNNVTVRGERFDFIVPTRLASVMTRDLKLVSYDVTKEYYTDALTPKVVKFNNGLSFLGDDSMQSTDLKGYDENHSVVSFYADYYLNHPHDNVVKNGKGAVVDASAQKRLAGDSYSVYVTFRISPGTIARSLVKTRQPDGYDAVLVFTNHPDDETMAALNAVAYGTEDTSSPLYGTKGMVPRGIGWTKGVFSNGQPGADLRDQDYKYLTDKLHQAGVEIVPHTITRLTDSREVVASGLQSLSQQYGTHDWEDHGNNDGIFNWEDLSSQGSLKGDENYIVDLLEKYNYNLAWCYNDLYMNNLDPNMLDPPNTSRITPYFFSNCNVDDNMHTGKKIYIWATISTISETDLVYTTANIDSLIAQRGVSIGHDYIAYVRDQNHTFWINPSTNKVEIYPAFDNELAYIQSKRESGLLWTPTMATFGDYLIGLSDVSIITNPDGTHTVTNNGPQSIKGVTLLAESAIASVTADGQKLSVLDDNKIVLPILSPGQSFTLSLTYPNVGQSQATNGQNTGSTTGPSSFGYQTVGTHNNGAINCMFFGSGSPASSGVAKSITVYISSYNAKAKVKCALYDASTFNLIGITEEKTITAIGPLTLAFTDPPSVVAGTKYLIVWWNGGASFQGRYDLGAPANTGGYVPINYGDWPDPLVAPNYEPAYFSIYCTFEQSNIPASNQLPP